MKKYELFVNDIDHTAGLRGTATFNCPFTADCENDRCFWKQRDCHGRCPWAVFDNPEHDKEQAAITEKYGDPYFPEWKIFPGTNCLMTYCVDTKVDGEFPNRSKTELTEDMCI